AGDPRRGRLCRRALAGGRGAKPRGRVGWAVRPDRRPPAGDTADRPRTGLLGGRARFGPGERGGGGHLRPGGAAHRDGGDRGGRAPVARDGGPGGGETTFAL